MAPRVPDNTRGNAAPLALHRRWCAAKGRSALTRPSALRCPHELLSRSTLSQTFILISPLEAGKRARRDGLVERERKKEKGIVASRCPSANSMAGERNEKRELRQRRKKRKRETASKCSPANFAAGERNKARTSLKRERKRKERENKGR